jgi:hypothetical protein
MRSALVREDLDVEVSEDCEGDHSILVMNSRCHPKGGMTVEYHKKEGTMVILCAVCEKFVCDIKVASDKDRRVQ